MPEIAELTDNPVFKCERCGFEYHKKQDYRPFLCHRCMRFISKKVFIVMNQIVPENSATIAEASEV